MNKKYTKKQITEAIAYWQKQLEVGNYKIINESYNIANIENAILDAAKKHNWLNSPETFASKVAQAFNTKKYPSNSERRNRVEELIKYWGLSKKCSYGDILNIIDEIGKKDNFVSDGWNKYSAIKDFLDCAENFAKAYNNNALDAIDDEDASNELDVSLWYSLVYEDGALDMMYKALQNKTYVEDEDDVLILDACSLISHEISDKVKFEYFTNEVKKLYDEYVKAKQNLIKFDFYLDKRKIN